jgi:hypothetical protein
MAAMRKSLQEIEDYYMSQGLDGEDLRKALNQDKEFQEILKERKREIKNKLGISDKDEEKYLLSREEDYEILAKVRQLESKDLTDNDKEVVRLILTQLEEEWREPLLNKLNELLEKY